MRFPRLHPITVQTRKLATWGTHTDPPAILDTPKLYDRFSDALIPIALSQSWLITPHTIPCMPCCGPASRSAAGPGLSPQQHVTAPHADLLADSPALRTL